MGGLLVPLDALILAWTFLKSMTVISSTELEKENAKGNTEVAMKKVLVESGKVKEGTAVTK